MSKLFLNLLSNYALPWLLLLLLGLTNVVPEPEGYQTYIVHMDHSQKPESFSTHESWHRYTLNSLSSVHANEIEPLIYSYSQVMHGFSARLTPSQLSQLESSPAHRATYQESFGKLLTTHSTNFLGLKRSSGIWPASSYGKDVIIGVLDSGIWPESESFADNGMSPVPERWKGKCENGTTFSPSLCNRKLIGAQSFSKGFRAAGIKISEQEDFGSARDSHGHGTHVASTAAGAHVVGASHFGYARGTARGVAPSARIAMYKVVWATTTLNYAASDVLAGMDRAISDGVDIMSLSLAFPPTPYFNDVIAIASLSAIEKGIFVSCAGGNAGPEPNTTVNGAPWIMTVGAGTMDRSFRATMTLGNELHLEGTSYYPESIFITNVPLHYGKGNVSKATCKFSSLDPKEVAGKVVLCDSDNGMDTSVHEQIEEVQRVGAYAGIFFADDFTLQPTDYSIPSLILQTSYGTIVKDYATTESKPVVKAMKFVITRLGTKPAPEVALFSSRGPDPITPGVLKPDILAPGVDILAATVPIIPYMEIGIYTLVTDYALSSGTSMAAPHLTGTAALLKAVHHNWSPAALRSALMTTAYTIDNAHSVLRDQRNGLPATPLDFGAGHVSPNKAMDPGLIYDMDFQDYIEFLCTLGYSNKQMGAVIRRSQWSCSRNSSNLNYPSFVAIFSKNDGNLRGKDFSRTLTNVGNENTSIYQAVLVAPTGMRISIEPSTLTFTRKYQKRSFVVGVNVDKDAPFVNYGYLKWIDQHNHIVTSPVVTIST